MNLAGRQSSSLVEPHEFGSLSGDSVEGVVDERVHDVHGLLGNADVGVDLFEDFVDVDGETLDSSSSGFLGNGWSGGFHLGCTLVLLHFNALQITTLVVDFAKDIDSHQL